MRHAHHSFKWHFVILVVFAIILSIKSSGFTFQTESIECLDNRDYLPAIHKLLSGAKSSIRVIMFAASYYPNKAESYTNRILSDLIKAKKRGVTVEVILECTDNIRDENLNKKNGDVKSLLEKEKIIVYNDDPKVTTHSKLVIIDEYITIIGSTNWKYSAIARNNESSVAISSKELAKHYLDYFKKIKKDR